MKKLLFGLLLAAAVLVYSGWSFLTRPHGDQTVSFDPARSECGTGKSGQWKYCIYRAAQGTNGGIAYLFHGRNRNEQMWNDESFYTAQVQEHWQNNGQKPPIVVSVSFGPTWLLAPKTSAAASGLLDVFQREVIPEMESLVGVPKHRSVFGQSMGGLNALIVGLALPNLFQKVAALCPVVYRTSPFAPFSHLREAILRTGAEPLVILGIVSVAKSYASNEEEWARMDPLSLANQGKAASATEFYLSAPLYDKYGNYEGVQDLAKKLQGKGVKTNWRPLYGGHCAVDIVSLAEFLL